MEKELKKIRVVVAIETRIYRDGITQLLEKYNDTKLVAAVSNKEDLFIACGTHSPNILLLDAMIPNALLIVKKIRQQYPNIQLIVLAMSACRKEMTAFSGEGVLGFVTREDSVDDLHHCIDAATGDGFWCSNRVAELLLSQISQVLVNTRNDSFDGNLMSLTRQQVKVIQFIESGLSNKEIARKLNIETGTVKNHVHQILRKLSVNTRCEAAATYRRNSELYSSA